jgi:3-hexulose-6-phosphate synthase
MKLQIALDVQTLKEAIDILSETHEYVDIAEVGTVGMYCGLIAVTEIKKAFPQLEVLADLKIPDGGEECAEAAFKAGADYVTVMGVADDVTIRGAVAAARKAGKQVVADMITVKNFAERVKEVDALGVDYIAVHIACDVQSADNTPFEQLALARLLVKHAKISVAGGINTGNVGEVAAAKPDIVISGMGICGSPDRKKAAMQIKQKLCGIQ